MGTTRFVLRNETKDKDGKCQVRLIYSVKGVRKYFKTDIKVIPEMWGDQQAIFLSKTKAKEQLPGVKYNTVPSSKDVDKLNEILASLRKEVSDIEEWFRISKIPYSSKMVVDKLNEEKGTLTKVEPTTQQVYDYIDKYILINSATRKKGSLSVYKSLKNHLIKFKKNTGRNISFESLDFSFFTEFNNFLIDKENLRNTTCAKQLSTLKTFINYARKEGVNINDKYKDFKIKKEKLGVIALTNDEFETLYNFDLSDNRRLAQVRDVFCFSCVTGLRYSDLNQLSRVHIHNDEIRLNIQKTSENLSIPLNPYSRAILAKYKDMLKPLPVITNAKMNLYLKELCKKAGINKPEEIVRFRGNTREVKIYLKHELISVHTGRKTFVTLSLEKGMSAEEVMTITGHLDYRSFSRYVKITQDRKKAVMAKAWKMSKKNNLKAV